MIYLKTSSELKAMKESGRIAARVLRELSAEARPGISTEVLDRMAVRIIKAEGGQASFKGYNGFPKSLCSSLNNEVVHGIPSKDRVVQSGDLLKIDVGVYKNGYHGDAAVTIGIPPIPAPAEKLIKTTKEALYKGIQKSIIGNHINDISTVIQHHVESNGYNVVRDLVGHGLGKKLHEDPQIPNFDDKHRGPELKSGMTLAIEPMVNAGKCDVRIASDNWTVITADGSLSAHFEHSVAVTPEGPWILTQEEN